MRARDPFYNEANIHADTEVCFALLRTCDFGFVHQVLTFSRVRPGSLTTLSEARATYFPWQLQLLRAYAPYYLTSEECEAEFAKFMLEYYRFLGKSLLLRRDKQFWSYHKRELSQSGLSFSRARLARGIAETLYDAALNPKDSVVRFLHSSRKLQMKDLMQNHREKQNSCSNTADGMGKTAV